MDKSDMILLAESSSTSSSSSSSSWWSMWINADAECLSNWQCSFSVYEIIWMEWKNTSWDAFVTDVFTWLTMFIWTVVVFWMIISALMYIFAWANEWLADKWKNWLKYSIIWLLLVIWSYVIVKWLAYIISWE